MHGSLGTQWATICVAPPSRGGVCGLLCGRNTTGETVITAISRDPQDPPRYLSTVRVTGCSSQGVPELVPDWFVEHPARMTDWTVTGDAKNGGGQIVVLDEAHNGVHAYSIADGSGSNLSCEDGVGSWVSGMPLVFSRDHVFTGFRGGIEVTSVGQPDFCRSIKTGSGEWAVSPSGVLAYVFDDARVALRSPNDGYATDVFVRVDEICQMADVLMFWGEFLLISSRLKPQPPIFIVDGTTAEVRRTLRCEFDRLWCLLPPKFSACFIACGIKEGKRAGVDDLHLYSVEGIVARGSSGPAQYIAVSPDGKYLAVCDGHYLRVASVPHLMGHDTTPRFRMIESNGN